MTSIAPTGAAGYPSPLDRLQTELQSEVTSGVISSSDQSALSTALDAIDQSLQADRSDGGQASGPPSPDQIKSKINDLINGEVQNGTLTSAQAIELQNVFANAFAKGGAHGHHGHHHDGDAADAGSGSGSSSPTDTLLVAISASSSDGASATGDGATSLIQTFLQSLQNSQQQGAGYGANGDTAGSPSNALVVDFTS